MDDQDALEGSGRGGSDNRDDLEASGSGLGPDDEDGDDDHGISRNFNQSNKQSNALSPLTFFFANTHYDFVAEFTGNNGLEVPSKPTEARPPYIIDETNVKTKQQVSTIILLNSLIILIL